MCVCVTVRLGRVVVVQNTLLSKYQSSFMFVFPALATVFVDSTHACNVYMSLCVCVCAPVPMLACQVFFGGWGGVCVSVSVPCVFQPSGVHRHTCLFVFSVFTLASLMLSSYSLAATGQLINQIFKQCFSAQWVVLDYLWQLAVHGAATL